MSKPTKSITLLGIMKAKSLSFLAQKRVVFHLVLLAVILLYSARILATASTRFDYETYYETHRALVNGREMLPDSALYALAGWGYVHGMSPDSLNFEHPPFAKYLIGISEIVFGSHTTLSAVFGGLTLLVVYLLSRKILTSYFVLLPSVLIALDKMFLELSSISLLDIYVTFFVALYVLLFVTFRHARWLWIPLGFTIGLAIASKWSGAFALPALIVFAAVEKDKRALSSLFLSLPIAVVTYASTYGVFFMAGHSLQDFISLQFQMASFQTYLRFGRGTPPPFWLLFNLLTGIEGPGVMTQLIAGRTLQTTSVQNGVFMLETFNPFTWPLAFSATIVAVVLAWKGRDRMALLPAFAFFSFLGLMSYGQLFVWYLLPALQFAFISLSYSLWRIYDSSGGTTRATLLFAGYLAATFLWSFFGQLPAFIPTG